MIGPSAGELQARFGRRAGWVRHHLAKALDFAGLFATERDVAWPSVRRLVFVCQGNICRSAYAEARALKLGLRATSFGLAAHEGVSANPVALARAQARSVDLSRHRARAAVPPLRGDLLLAMEPAHLASLARRTRARVTLLGLWARPERPHLEDPYGLSDAYFDTCFDVIDSALFQIALLAPGARAR